MGFSRNRFYLFRDLYEQGGEAALSQISRRKPVIKNRVDDAVEAAVVALPPSSPPGARRHAQGQLRVSNELAKQGVCISSGGVRSVWLRHDLETFAMRLKALSARVAQDGLILTEDQLKALKSPQTNGICERFHQMIQNELTTTNRSAPSGVSSVRA
jgi:hypothetical protein